MVWSFAYSNSRNQHSKKTIEELSKFLLRVIPINEHMHNIAIACWHIIWYIYINNGILSDIFATYSDILSDIRFGIWSDTYWTTVWQSIWRHVSDLFFHIFLDQYSDILAYLAFHLAYILKTCLTPILTLEYSWDIVWQFPWYPMTFWHLLWCSGQRPRVSLEFTAWSDWHRHQEIGKFYEGR